MKRQGGYTLVEMMVSIAVGMVVVLIIYAMINMVQRSSVNIERKVAQQQDTRAALGLMALEIEMASFNSTYAPNPWVDPGNCTAGSGNVDYRGIQSATPFSITVEADVNQNGVVGGVGNPNEVINYDYDLAEQYITRSTTCDGSDEQAFLGDSQASGNPRSVRVINTATVPIFRYFDSLGSEIFAAQLPAGIPNIAMISITLWVETGAVDPSSGQRKRMIYSTGVSPRNHVIAD